MTQAWGLSIALRNHGVFRVRTWVAMGHIVLRLTRTVAGSHSHGTTPRGTPFPLRVVYPMSMGTV